MTDFEPIYETVSQEGEIDSGEPERGAHHLDLSRSTVKFLDSELENLQRKGKVFAKLPKLFAEVGTLRQASLIAMIRDKFQSLLGQEKAHELVSVDLTDNEIEFLNDRFVQRVHEVQDQSKEHGNEVAVGSMRAADSDFKQELIPAFREFNYSLMKSGISPHPEASKMFGFKVSA